ncbi:hypothetical protein, partial [Bacteroides uniformis]|uniref:hypothetical protein n=1 Tax=Bacteroides uniformis TaxID=820 RepID=UPI001AA1CD65
PMEDSSEKRGSNSSAEGGKAEATCARSTSTPEPYPQLSKPEEDPSDYGFFIEEEQPPHQIQDVKDQNA